MNVIYRLEDAVVGPIGRALDGAAIATLARFTFLATLAMWFWTSALTKLGPGIGGIFSPSLGAYAQIFPKQMEAVGYDPSQLGTGIKLVVIAGTWGEFIIPALLIVGLFTRAAAVAMIVLILVISFVDITGHGADALTIGSWFDKEPDSKILDQRLLWIFLMLVIIIRGAGPLSLDALFRQRA